MQYKTVYVVGSATPMYIPISAPQPASQIMPGTYDSSGKYCAVPRSCPCCNGAGWIHSEEGFNDTCWHCDGSGEDPEFAKEE